MFNYRFCGNDVTLKRHGAASKHLTTSLNKYISVAFCDDETSNAVMLQNNHRHVSAATISHKHIPKDAYTGAAAGYTRCDGKYLLVAQRTSAMRYLSLIHI